MGGLGRDIIRFNMCGIDWGDEWGRGRRSERECGVKGGIG